MSHGIGYDTHRLVAGRPLILGGVSFEDAELGLEGHSDADVLTHAIIDAILGAAGLGDIGEHFPDTNPAFKDADSLQLLETTRALIGADGLRVKHVDATVVMERPRLGPHKQQIRETLARVLRLRPHHVNIKATTGEGMGFVGRGEGIAALAIASVMGAPPVPGAREDAPPA
ncbi:MAG: 2-C-methyl-D-erythritol 2,4-cyclodiphosphate synthase [Solirubrobacteraceae bacterium]